MKKLERITSEVDSVKEFVDIGWVKIGKTSKGNLWLENVDTGEGMMVNSATPEHAELQYLLLTFWEKNF